MSMAGRELVKKILSHEEAERLPRDIWTVPYIGMFRQDEMDSFLKMYPRDFTWPSGLRYGNSRYSGGNPYRKGKYTDEFGCEWQVMEDGIAGEVKNPIIKTQADLDDYKLPWEMLDEMDWNNQR